MVRGALAELLYAQGGGLDAVLVGPRALPRARHAAPAHSALRDDLTLVTVKRV